MKQTSNVGRWTWLASLLIAASSVVACGELHDPDAFATSTAPIQGGAVDEETTSVVGIAIQQGFAGGLCSGSLIAPNMVLTAQHCVSRIPPGGIICGQATFGETYRPTSFSVTTATNMTTARRDAFYSVRSVHVPRAGGDVCGEDIAVLILDQPIPASEAVPLVPRIDDEPLRAERYSALGYGHVGDDSGAGIRRKVSGRNILCSGVACTQFGNFVRESEFVGDRGACQGDSGGPAIDEMGRVMGALSRGGDGCRFPTYAGVWAWTEWLTEIGHEAAEVGGYTPPIWVLTGVSDGSFEDRDEDGIPDEIDNCPDVPNPDQSDVDRDGVGDACDDNDNRDRGGRCAVCNGCFADDECPSGGECVDFGGGGVCTFDCSDGFACPDGTQCFDLPAGGATRSLCLNADAASEGVCASGFICGGLVSDVPDDGCRVCAPCYLNTDCGADGFCMETSGGTYCTTSCDDDNPCPGDATCFNVGDDRLCFNPDAGAAGVCHGSYLCEATTGSDDDGPGGDAAPGGGAGGSSSQGGGGCSATRGTSPGAAWTLALLALAAGGRRRR